MPELLLHFSIPFALAKTKFSVKESIIIGLAALLPDLDALLHVHRWATHSLILLSIAFTPPIALAYKLNHKHLKLLLASYLAALSHIAMDAFQTYTPILHPAIDQSVWLKVEGNVTIASTITPKLAATILTAQTNFKKFSALDAPIFTSEGLIISLILTITPILLTARKAK